MTQHEVKGANEKGHISFQNLWTFFQRAELLKKKKKLQNLHRKVKQLSPWMLVSYIPRNFLPSNANSEFGACYSPYSSKGEPHNLLGV